MILEPTTRIIAKSLGSMWVCLKMGFARTEWFVYHHVFQI